MKYLRYFESVSETSVMDIKDILIDLIHNDFYIEVCLLHDYGPGSNKYEPLVEHQLENDDDLIKLGDDFESFHVYMCLEKLLSEETENVSFCWSDVSDPVTHLINMLSSKYKFDGCRANISFNGEDYDIHNVYHKSYDNKTITMSCVVDNTSALSGGRRSSVLSKTGNMIKIDINEKVIYNIKITFGQK